MNFCKNYNHCKWNERFLNHTCSYFTVEDDDLDILILVIILPPGGSWDPAGNLSGQRKQLPNTDTSKSVRSPVQQSSSTPRANICPVVVATDVTSLEGLAVVFAPPPPHRQTAVLPPLTTLLTDVDPNVFPAVSYKFERVNFRRFQLLNTGRLYPCCHEHS